MRLVVKRVDRARVNGRTVGSYWVRLVASNGAIVMQSEMYATLSNARRAARRLGDELGLDVEES